jgi:hypothetical protein
MMRPKPIGKHTKILSKGIDKKPNASIIEDERGQGQSVKPERIML